MKLDKSTISLVVVICTVFVGTNIICANIQDEYFAKHRILHCKMDIKGTSDNQGLLVQCTEDDAGTYRYIDKAKALKAVGGWRPQRIQVQIDSENGTVTWIEKDTGK